MNGYPTYGYRLSDNRHLEIRVVWAPKLCRVPFYEYRVDGGNWEPGERSLLKTLALFDVAEVLPRIQRVY